MSMASSAISSFRKLSTPRKVAIGAAGAGLLGAGAMAGHAMGSNDTTINKIAEEAFIDELQKIALTVGIK